MLRSKESILDTGVVSPAQTPGFLCRYRGVSTHKQSGKWVAQIKAAGKQVYLGFYSEQADAARAYDQAVIHMQVGPTRGEEGKQEEKQLSGMTSFKSASRVGLKWMRPVRCDDYSPPGVQLSSCSGMPDISDCPRLCLMHTQ